MPPSSSPQPPSNTNERLEVPTLPPPSSRFVLPPPPSDLLNRLQAFLPQIRDANAMLAERPPTGEGEEGQREEAVIMEEMSDSSDDDSDSSDSSDSSSEDEEDGDEDEGVRLTSDGSLQQQGEEERGTLAHLMDISARTAPATGAGGGKKVVLVQEEGQADEGKEKMEAE
ncbi:hypothetical protein JCM11251_000642 [Rhodosporidiobolus azoricus]